MKPLNLPALDDRYWVGMLLASILGTTFGDFISNDLDLGFAKGLLPLGLILAVVFVVERKARITTEAFYWVAIVLTRAMATNLADLATHGMKLNYLGVLAVVLAVAIAIMTFRRTDLDSTAAPSTSEASLLPYTGVRYWLLMLTVSTLGTALGDYFADELGLGVQAAAILSSLVFIVMLHFQNYGSRLAGPSGVGGYLESIKVGYWAMILLVRTTGTVVGDSLLVVTRPRKVSVLSST
jgi:uncharacterized membrane-anchored protein